MSRKTTTTHARAPRDQYYDDAGRRPLLTAAEERALAARIQAGDISARNELALANLRLVIATAKHFRGRGLPLEDLIAEGNLGLFRAARDYNPARARFSTYATWWIIQAIQDSIRNSPHPVRVPAYVRSYLQKWHHAAAALEDQLGRPPSRAETAEAMGCGAKWLQIAGRGLDALTAADVRVSYGERSYSLDELAVDPGAPPEAGVDHAELAELLAAGMDSLDDRERTVIRLRFGLDDEEPHTLKQVGETLGGLTRERVRQIEMRALAKLRERLADAV